MFTSCIHVCYDCAINRSESRKMDEQAKRRRKISDDENDHKEKRLKISGDNSKSLDTSRSTCSPTEKPRRDEDYATSSCKQTSGETSHVKWRELRAENLDCDYCVLYSRTEADALLVECERDLAYNEGALSKVKNFGKWHDIPRKQVAHGDSGLSYNFSGTSVRARPWTPLLRGIRDRISAVTGHTFNFVLVNRYKDGSDHIGEHRDDEKDLVSGHPIASLYLGQARDFVFKHADARGRTARRSIEPVTLELDHGGLLMMKHPTNTFWYHSLPRRKRLTNIRINMTFRKMVERPGVD